MVLYSFDLHKNNQKLGIFVQNLFKFILLASKSSGDLPLKHKESRVCIRTVQEKNWNSAQQSTHYLTLYLFSFCTKNLIDKIKRCMYGIVISLAFMYPLQQCSGSECFWAIRILLSSSKNTKKNLDFFCFVTSLWLFIIEEWCNCTFKKYIRLHNSKQSKQEDCLIL